MKNIREREIDRDRGRERDKGNMQREGGILDIKTGR